MNGRRASLSNLLVPWLLALAPPAAGGTVESFWIVTGGDFHDPASWNGPVPDGTVTAIFDLDMPLGPGVEFNADAVSDRVLVRDGVVFFYLWDSTKNGFEQRHYDVLSPTLGAASIVVGEETGDVAELRIQFGSVTAESMVVGLMEGSAGTVRLNSFINQLFGELTCNGLLHVGSAGQGLLVFGQQTAAICDGATLGVQDSGFGEVVLNNSSEWTIANQLTVGKQGQGLLTISGLGDLTSGSALIGQSPDSAGEVSVIGQGSTWTINGSLDVGLQGQGTLLVSGGGAVFTNGFAAIGTLPEPQFPPDSGGIGDVTVTGPASLWLVDGDVHVGFQWLGSLNVLDGATVTSFSGDVGNPDEPGSEVHVEGPGSVWSNIGDVTVFAPALLRVVGGAILIASTLEIGGQFDGDGTVVADVDNSGTIVVGDPIGTLVVDGSFSGQSSSDLQIELGGPDPGMFDRMEVTRGAGHTGQISVTLAGGYVPQAGDSFEIMAAASLNVGSADVNLPALPPDLKWLYVTDSNSITLEARLLGDIDGDGTVGTADLLLMFANWNLCPDPLNCPADLNGNGTVGTSDLLILLGNWS